LSKLNNLNKYSWLPAHTILGVSVFPILLAMIYLCNPRPKIYGKKLPIFIQRMKYIILITVLLFTINSYAQVKNIKLLIARTEQEVVHYFDSLNALKSSGYNKIERNISKDGDLVIMDNFFLLDESFFSCQGVLTFFNRIDGKEICDRQIILGSSEFAYLNLTFIKDVFKFISTNHWEYYPNDKFKIAASFERKSGSPSSYSIVYELKDR